MADRVYCYGWCWEIRNNTASLLLRRFWSKNDWIASRTWNRVKNTADEKWGRWVDEMRGNVNGPDCITIKSMRWRKTPVRQLGRMSDDGDGAILDQLLDSED